MPCIVYTHKVTAHLIFPAKSTETRPKAALEEFACKSTSTSWSTSTAGVETCNILEGGQESGDVAAEVHAPCNHEQGKPSLTQPDASFPLIRCCCRGNFNQIMLEVSSSSCSPWVKGGQVELGCPSVRGMRHFSFENVCQNICWLLLNSGVLGRWMTALPRSLTLSLSLSGSLRDSAHINFNYFLAHF